MQGDLGWPFFSILFVSNLNGFL